MSANGTALIEPSKEKEVMAATTPERKDTIARDLEWVGGIDANCPDPRYGSIYSGGRWVYEILPGTSRDEDRKMIG